MLMMEKENYENGGTVITWKIHNFHCLESDKRLYSPYFYIGTNHKAKYRLYLYPDCFFFQGEAIRTPLNINISYSSLISINDSTIVEQRSGVIPYSKYSSVIGSFYSFKVNENAFSSTLILRCCLRIISDNSLIVNEYKFQSVIEAEHRRFQYTNLPLQTFNQNEKLLFPSPFACSLTTPLEIKFDASEKKDSINMDITNTSKSENNFLLICKFSLVDKQEKHLFTATHSKVFMKETTNVWRFPTPINLKDLQSTVSPTDIVSLDFEFLISERKINTWVEEFSEAPIPQTKIVTESYEKNKVYLRDDFMCLYIERKFPDLEIIVGGKKFPAHKTILCARSPVFSAMFENNMLEKEKNVVEISDLDPETVDKMLFFMYSEILQDQEWDGVAKLYAAADKYQIMTLKDKCASILIEQLSPKNACEALHLADLHCDSDFLNAIQDFIVTHYEEILQSEEWREFMDSNSKIACKTMHKAWLHRSKKLKEGRVNFFDWIP